jgi:6-pyruvoyl-tetrahydropterin synthase
MKYEVCGTLHIDFKIDVEADDEEAAEGWVRDMTDVYDVLDNETAYEIDVHDISEAKDEGGQPSSDPEAA